MRPSYSTFILAFALASFISSCTRSNALLVSIDAESVTINERVLPVIKSVDGTFSYIPWRKLRGFKPPRNDWESPDSYCTEERNLCLNKKRMFIGPFFEGGPADLRKKLKREAKKDYLQFVQYGFGSSHQKNTLSLYGVQIQSKEDLIIALGPNFESEFHPFNATSESENLKWTIDGFRYYVEARNDTLRYMNIYCPKP